MVILASSWDPTHLKQLSFLLALAGLILATALIGWFGAGHVADALLSVGWEGLSALLGWNVLLAGLLGLAWAALMPPGTAPLGGLIWARMVRDAAGNCLPFSQMGGVVLGTRALAMQGVRWPLAAAGSVVDVTAEFLAQVGFMMIGLIELLNHAPGSRLTVPVGVGLVLAGVGAAGFMWLQRGGGRLFGALARRIAAPWFAEAPTHVRAFQDDLARLYASPTRLGLGVGLHLIGWIAGGTGTWIAFQLLGADIDFDDVLAIDALTHIALSATVLVPAGAGVQEAAYASLGAVFGVPAELSLGVSLLRRARDLAIGVPILLVWQTQEMRRAALAAHMPAGPIG